MTTRKRTSLAKKHKAGLRYLGMVLLIFTSLFSVLWMYSLSGNGSGSSSQEQQPLPGWQLYSNNRCNDYQGPAPFALQVPESWYIDDSGSSDEKEVSAQTYTFSTGGSELILMCGDGFGGGGCPEEALIDLQLKNQTVQGCLLPSDDQTKLQLSLTYLETPRATFGIRGTVDNTQAGRTLLNDILASFTVEE